MSPDSTLLKYAGNRVTNGTLCFLGATDSPEDKVEEGIGFLHCFRNTQAPSSKIGQCQTTPYVTVLTARLAYFKEKMLEQQPVASFAILRRIE